MTIYIDADGCPVVDITVGIAKHIGVECIIICDTSHVFTARKIRMSGTSLRFAPSERLKGSSKRTAEQDTMFEKMLREKLS